MHVVFRTSTILGISISIKYSISLRVSLELECRVSLFSATTCYFCPLWLWSAYLCRVLPGQYRSTAGSTAQKLFMHSGCLSCFPYKAKLDLLTVWSQNRDVPVVHRLNLRFVSKGEMIFAETMVMTFFIFFLLDFFEQCVFFVPCSPPDKSSLCVSHCTPSHQTITMCSPFQDLISPIANLPVRYVWPPE